MNHFDDQISQHSAAKAPLSGLDSKFIILHFIAYFIISIDVILSVIVRTFSYSDSYYAAPKIEAHHQKCRH